MRCTFHRQERLKSEKIISRLFKEGNSFACYPLRLVWMEIEPYPTTAEDAPPLSIKPTFPILFSLTVAKKTFKRANKRNILRRRLREAYRLHKAELYNYLTTNELYQNKQYAFMVMYVAKEALPYIDIENGIKKMIYKFKKELHSALPKQQI
jgi:ribonuclease P protein component